MQWTSIAHKEGRQVFARELQKIVIYLICFTITARNTEKTTAHHRLIFTGTKPVAALIFDLEVFML